MIYINKNIRHLRQLKALTQEQLAEDLGETRANLSSKEEGRSMPSLELLVKLSDYFRLPVDILLRRDLTKATDFEFIEVGNQRVLFPITVDGNNEDMIEVVPVKTSAGYLAGYDDPEYIERLQKIKLPFLPTGKHRAFPIKGDSMLPMKDGAYVVGRYVETLSDVRDGRTYVLLTRNDGMVYKRVYNELKNRGSFRLVSDNATYVPYEVPVADVLEIWEFVCSINTQEYRPEELKLDSIQRMLNELGVELEALKGRLG